MTEVAYYARFEAGFEAYPAENYVDYMTNVMPVPEKHFIYIPRRSISIVCEIRRAVEGKRVLEWSLRKYDTLPANLLEIRLDRVQVEEMISFLDELPSPRVCEVCEKYLGDQLKYY